MIPSDTVIGNYQVPNGTYAMALIDALGKSDEFFPNANKFLPERWLKDYETKPHPFAYLPFGYGPRTCAGKRFVELEIKILVFELLRNFKIEWKSKEKFDAIFESVSKPANPLKFKFVDL